MPKLFSHLPFLPLVQLDASGELPKEDLLLPLARIAPLLIPAPALKTVLSILPRTSEYWAQVNDDISADVAIALLDAGATKVVTSNPELFASLPADRLVLALNEDALDVLADDADLTETVQSILLELPVGSKGFDKQVVAAARSLIGGKPSKDAKDLFILPVGDQPPTIKHLEQLSALNLGTTPCLPTSILSAQPPKVVTDVSLSSSLKTAHIPPLTGFHLPIDVLFLSSLTTDRTDALYATLVTSPNEPPLGLVYSSSISISLSILTAQATYYSRSRSSLWVKGATSGATQTVVAIRRDCDGDALEFIVEQKAGTGFCHTLRASSCFGPSTGLTALESTLQERKQNAPAGSYTKRLFEDATLLEAKLREEAEEVCQAKSWEETRLEAADLLYFLMVRCSAMGVNMADVQDVLDARASKVTRRPGNAKAPFLRSPVTALPKTLLNADGPGSGQTSKTASPLTKSSDLAAPALGAVATQLPAAQASASTGSSDIVPPVYDLTGVAAKQREEFLKRPLTESKEMLDKVEPIISKVRSQGDAGLRAFVAQFDRCLGASDANWPLVLTAPFDESLQQLTPETKQAIDTAFANIHLFHSKQMEKESQVLKVQTMPGIECTRFARAISRVGLYIPGGTAVLPSTALMLCIPAAIAGCQSITVATPADAEGRVRPEIVYIASKCGVKQIVKAGGAHAVAAMAYGTESVTKVDKIFGPGNQWVTAAKMAVSMDTSAAVSIDMPAGPSEVLVIADKSANPVFVAADLLSQAEHGPDSQVVLLAVSLAEDHLDAIKQQVSKQAHALPRVDIVRKCIAQSLIIKVATRDDAIAFSNDYAPEHLILHLEDAPSVLPQVQNAGSVFVGQWSPESLGDYASGTNHTLPTMAYARQYSGVSTSSFLKHITSQQLTLAGLKLLGPTVDHLARIEGLDAHARAVTLRLSSEEAKA